MAQNWKIRLSGTGGQGVIKGAMVLAEAALIDGNNATQSQVYGPESRGGSTRAEVNISDKQILFPKVETPNLLLTMSLEAYDKYSGNIAQGGILVLDGDIGKDGKHEGVKVYSAPITVIARDQLGNEMCANVVALGVINAITHMVSDEGMEESLRRNFKSSIFDLNMRAYQAGLQAVIAGK
ncbi:MAG: 2-oxoacid:acceptor oxidoreductase family protein [Clostridiales bacterium]|nr:2-oxoacid:acceptor oxidoreductase family protein [Clostridiales bacterium]